MLRAERINSVEPSRIQLPKLHTADAEVRAGIRAYLATAEGQAFIDDCRHNIPRTKRKDTP